MNQITKKVFHLSDISYPWLLIISMVLFLAALYNDKVNAQTAAIEGITYGMPIVLAVIWGILNYIDHIKLNARFKRMDNIDVYVENLLMSKDEKAELKGYLEDYSQDLMSQGKPKEEAIKAAIGQFAVQEFSSLSNHSSIINLSTHFYLLGYVVISLTSALLLQILTVFFAGSFWLLAAEFMFTSYGIGFLSLFFLYRLMNSIITRNINH